MAFYYTATPNVVIEIDEAWARKVAAVSEYRTQFEADEIPELIAAIDAKARLVASSTDKPVGTLSRAEGLTL